MLLINAILTALIVILMLPVAVLLVQVLAAIFLPKTVTETSIEARVNLAVLMPAHNEALVITETVQSILSQLTYADQLLVVADNCSDDTAVIARNLGASVVERSNLQQRGKGYALDFGLQQLKNNPPQVLLIIDADCIMEKNAVQLLASACVLHQRPIQALYLMQSQPNPSLKERIAEFAWLIKNKVRPLGFNVLHLPCQLMGTGMAFLWKDMNQVSLANGHLVEDMKLGIDFARLNKAPLFLPDALVTSVFPPSQAASDAQRARWEHGHLSVILSEAPTLFFEAIKHRNMQMLGLAFDLIVPPLAALSVLCVAVFILSLLLMSKFALLLASILCIALVSAILLAWAFFGRHIISFRQLCYAPIYAVLKIPLYIKFFFNRQVEWVRAKRD